MNVEQSKPLAENDRGAQITTIIASANDREVVLDKIKKSLGAEKINGTLYLGELLDDLGTDVVSVQWGRPNKFKYMLPTVSEEALAKVVGKSKMFNKRALEKIKSSSDDINRFLNDPSKKDRVIIAKQWLDKVVGLKNINILFEPRYLLSPHLEKKYQRSLSMVEKPWWPTDVGLGASHDNFAQIFKTLFNHGKLIVQDYGFMKREDEWVPTHFTIENKLFPQERVGEPQNGLQLAALFVIPIAAYVKTDSFIAAFATFAVVLAVLSSFSQVEYKQPGSVNLTSYVDFSDLSDALEKQEIPSQVSWLYPVMENYIRGVGLHMDRYRHGASAFLVLEADISPQEEIKIDPKTPDQPQAGVRRRRGGNFGFL